MTTRYVSSHGRQIEVETINPDGPAKAKRRPKDEPFVNVPLRWAATAAKATKTPKAFVWIALLYACWKARSATCSLSNAALVKYGINRETKRRALAELKAAGLITIEQTPGQAPIVTLL
jgi:hypothetical protein